MKAGRTGFTTGTCAAGAAKAAVLLLCDRDAPDRVGVTLPDGTGIDLPLAFARKTGDTAEAAIRKDAGDDPDVTDGCLVVAAVTWTGESEIRILAGEGVGTVTKPGLSVPPGEPAVNPVPRLMIRTAIAEVTDRPVQVTISIPGGRELAEKTFNPRLGIEGGLSILGTSGIVRPFSCEALRDALKCALSVARGCGVTHPVFVPGRIGEKAARRHFAVTSEQLIEVSNEWGFMLDEARSCPFESLLVLGHPGKLAKLMTDQWDTHSSRSVSAVPAVLDLGRTVCGFPLPESKTVEGVLSGLEEQHRRKLADELAHRIGIAVLDRIGHRYAVSVVLVNMGGDLLGHYGDLCAWQRSTQS
jgi:cobalt-precorrin-5B (C1)-methyltransferase